MHINHLFSKFFIVLLIFTSPIVYANQETITKEKINKFYNSVVSINSKEPQEA